MDEVPQSALDRGTLLALVNASKTILSPLNLHDRFQRIAEEAARVLEAQGASVLILDRASGQLVFEAATGPGSEKLLGERFDADLGIAGQALKNNRIIRVDDVTVNHRFFSGIDEKTKLKTQAILAAPLVHDEHVIGVLEVINPLGRDRFSPRDVQLLEVFANFVAMAARNAQALDRVSRENRGLRESLPQPEIVGQSETLNRAMTLCRKVAPTQSTVLVTGPTGTGKELAARAIHDWSPRQDKPFIAVNCAALPETLLESELFGHERGAFTGAIEQRPGRFELADGGTLLLDEIGEMTLSTQVKLLRVLQDRQFTRVGGTRTLTCDVRLIAATNRDLKKEMDEGRFRADLYYRLNVFPITLPALRERIDDVPLLVEHFVKQLAPSLGIAPPRINPEAMACMMRYDWPGNIRELRNVVERCALLCERGEIRASDLPTEVVRAGGVSGLGSVPSNGSQVAASHAAVPGGVLASGEPEPVVAAGESGSAPLESKLASQERSMVLTALQNHGWNQSAAARSLGISRDNLRYRMAKYQLKKPELG